MSFLIHMLDSGSLETKRPMVVSLSVECCHLSAIDCRPTSKTLLDSYSIPLHPYPNTREGGKGAPTARPSAYLNGIQGDGLGYAKHCKTIREV